MTAVEFCVRVLDALESLGVPYVTVGSFAVNAYVEPRSTRDADFVVQLDDFPVARLVDLLGGDFTADPQLSFESITLTPRIKLRHRDAIFTVEFFGLTDDPHDQARFARRREGAVGHRRAFVLSPEDIVVTKLNWSARGRRPKDLDDVKNVLKTTFGSLDLAYIRGWCDRHGTRELFEKLYAEAEAFERGGPVT